VVGWGDNSTGQLGASVNTCKSGGTSYSCDRYATPITALAGLGITELAGGVGFSAVLASEGKVYTVGTNTYGELGNDAKCENEGGELGYQGTCYSRTWSAVPGVTHVQAIAAGGKDVAAIVGSSGTMPAQVFGAEPQALAERTQWNLPEAETSYRLGEAIWRHPGEDEFAEPPEPEGSTGGSTGEEGSGVEPPKNTTLPVLKKVEYVDGKAEPAPGPLATGTNLESTAGNWEDPAPLAYEYQWKRCKSSKCTPIGPWVSGGETTHGERLAITEEDVGYTIEVEVAAHREGEAPCYSAPSGVAEWCGYATSAASEVVKSAGEGYKGNTQWTSLDGVNGYLLDELDEEPLATEAYELKLSARGGVKSPKTWTMVSTPLS
jgi:hypothetical protein